MLVFFCWSFDVEVLGSGWRWLRPRSWALGSRCGGRKPRLQRGPRRWPHHYKVLRRKNQEKKDIKLRIYKIICIIYIYILICIRLFYILHVCVFGWRSIGISTCIEYDTEEWYPQSIIDSGTTMESTQFPSSFAVMKAGEKKIKSVVADMSWQVATSSGLWTGREKHTNFGKWLSQSHKVCCRASVEICAGNDFWHIWLLNRVI